MTLLLVLCALFQDADLVFVHRVVEAPHALDVHNHRTSPFQGFSDLKPIRSLNCTGFKTLFKGYERNVSC